MAATVDRRFPADIFRLAPIQGQVGFSAGAIARRAKELRPGIIGSSRCGTGEQQGESEDMHGENWNQAKGGKSRKGWTLICHPCYYDRTMDKFQEVQLPYLNRNALRGGIVHTNPNR
jgi:hypothetical protein